MSSEIAVRVESACSELIEEGTAVTFTAVAAKTGLSKATLYRRPELRATVEEHRARDHEAYSLAGLVVEIDHLRQGLDAVADKVRRQEEQLRVLRRQVSKQK